MIEGPKGVGKTAAALQRAATVHQLDDPAQRDVARADLARLLAGKPPVLLDEWQFVPECWDQVRRAVDAEPRIVDRDFPELGHAVRNPAALRRWMAAYAAASSTTGPEAYRRPDGVAVVPAALLGP